MRAINPFKILNNKIFWLPILSAIFWFLSLPPVGLTFFSWVALVPLLFFLKSGRVSLKQAVWGSAWVGFFHALAVLWPLATLNAWWWLPYENSGFLYSIRGVILLLLLIPASFYSASIFYMIFSFLFRKLGKGSVFSILTFSFLWALMEIIRLPFVLGFTWGVVGYNLHNYLYLRQLAGFLGIFSLSFLVIFVNLCLFFLIKEAVSKYGKENSSLNLVKVFNNRIFYSIIIVLVFFNLYGFWVVRAGNGFDRSLKVAATHSGLTTEESRRDGVYSEYMRSIKEAVKTGAELVVLPENFFMPFLLHRDTKLPEGYGHPGLPITRQFDELMKISSENGEATIVAGIHVLNGKEKANSLVSIKGGEIIDIYDKRRLLPITESGRLTAGLPRKSFITLSDTLKASALVCSEVVFPFLAKGKEADFILNSSNDSVFLSKTVGLQNHIMAKMRATENRKYLVRSVKGGISAIFDPFGRVISQTVFDTDNDGEIIFAEIKY